MIVNFLPDCLTSVNPSPPVPASRIMTCRSRGLFLVLLLMLLLLLSLGCCCITGKANQEMVQRKREQLR